MEAKLMLVVFWVAVLDIEITTDIDATHPEEKRLVVEPPFESTKPATRTFRPLGGDSSLSKLLELSAAARRFPQARGSCSLRETGAPSSCVTPVAES